MPFARLIKSDVEEIITQIDAFRQSVFNVDEFRPLNPLNARLSAVDGGSACLIDGVTFVVVAIRTGHVTFDGPRRTGDDLSAVRLRWMESRAEDLSYLVSHTRERMEVQQALRAIERLNPGDSIVMDGSLPAKPDEAWKALYDAAIERGVYLMALSKRTSLSVGRWPVAPLATSTSRRTGIKAPWYVSLGTDDVSTYLVCLHPFTNWVFRVDVLGDSPTPLGCLIRYSTDALYPGYPYPLAAAHNMVTLSRGEVDYIMGVLRTSLGMERMYELESFFDLHTVLDANR